MKTVRSGKIILHLVADGTNQLIQRKTFECVITFEELEDGTHQVTSSDAKLVKVETAEKVTIPPEH